MKFLDNMKTGKKLFGAFFIVILLLIVVGLTGYFSMKAIDGNMETMYQERLIPIQNLGGAKASFYKLRGDIYKYGLIPSARAEVREDIEKDIAEINQALANYDQTSLTKEEKDGLDRFNENFTNYQYYLKNYYTLMDNGKEDQAFKLVLDGGLVSIARQATSKALDDLIVTNQKIADDLKNESDTAFRNSTIFIFLAAIGSVFAAVWMGATINNSITKPLAIMSMGLMNLKNGDLNRDVPEEVKGQIMGRTDEIGLAGLGLGQTEMYLVEMAAIASRIAGGDLTVEVKPRCEKDELGNAFVEMVTGLRKLIEGVVDNATHLQAASMQLAAAADQAGQATSQISTTVQQVAKGISNQTEHINRTASSVDQLTRAIDGIARGAAEQSSAVTVSGELTARINEAIQQVAGNAEAVSKDSLEASRLAEDGAKTVHETIDGMKEIKQKAEISASKVQEMGSRSNEIGVILETIEEIASQTNLLALNAAIEAARAGEHGKGFAVVADEVRKLAERASSSTKEIGGLIKNIQKTVREAVQSMEEGSLEVEKGVEKANSAGTALENILVAARAVRQQADLAAGAVASMNDMAGQLLAAADTVSAVVEQNTAATEEMAASSSEVTEAVESIASVSEENSASVEEVSASAEEMSAQVEEVNASAHSLSQMAAELRQMVSLFKLPGRQTESGGWAEEPVDDVRLEENSLVVETV